MLLNYSLPIFIPFVESAWLGEDFPRRLWIPVAVGFSGDRHPAAGRGLMEPVALLGVASALFAGGPGRSAAADRTEPWRVVFYFAITATVLSACPRPCLADAARLVWLTAWPWD